MIVKSSRKFVESSIPEPVLRVGGRGGAGAGALLPGRGGDRGGPRGVPEDLLLGVAAGAQRPRGQGALRVAG